MGRNEQVRAGAVIGRLDIHSTKAFSQRAGEADGVYPHSVIRLANMKPTDSHWSPCVEVIVIDVIGRAVIWAAVYDAWEAWRARHVITSEGAPLSLR